MTLNNNILFATRHQANGILLYVECHRFFAIDVQVDHFLHTIFKRNVRLFPDMFGCAIAAANGWQGSR